MAAEKLAPLKAWGLFLEQGTGKTLTQCEIIRRKMETAGFDGMVYWFTPCNVRESLRNEIEKILGEFPAWIEIHGIESLSQSKTLFLELDAKITVRDMIVIDESDLLQNHKTKRTRYSMCIGSKARYRAILTGTPFTEGKEYVYSQMTFLSEKILGYKSFNQFKANHLEEHPKRPGYYINVLNVDYLAAKINPYVYEAKKRDCVELPEKRYSAHSIEPTDRIHEANQCVKDKMFRSIEEYGTEQVMNFFVMFRKVAAGITPGDFDDYRINAVRPLLTECNVVYCSFIEAAGHLAESLNAGLITGEVSPKKRSVILKQWRSNGGTLVVTHGTMGRGVNLVECRNVVFYDNDFSYSKRIQAEDRFHRIGQTQDVVYHDLSATGMDRRIKRCLDRKQNAFREFMREIREIKDNREKIKEFLQEL
jgi:SNF2 family DNA or RNA helicase